MMGKESCLFMIGLVLLPLGAALFSGTPSLGHSATEDDFLRLHNNLTANYSRHMRPVKNQSAPVLLTLYFNLISVLEIRDTESQLDVMAILQVNWQDPNLVWDPQDYGGINRVRLTEDTIWAPKMSLYMSQSKDGENLWKGRTTHNVWSSGTVSFSNVDLKSTFCELDLTYFPYDYQTCNFDFNVIDATVIEVDIASANAVLSRSFIQNKEWLVMQISSSVVYFGYTDVMPLIKVTIILQRRPTFNSLNIIVPAIIMTILCMLTFFVPMETGERLSYTLTTLLSLSVYLTYIGGIIPRSSNPVPVLFEYVVSMFITCSMSVVFTLLVIKVRWSRVRRSPGDQKYIRVFKVRIYLSRKRWLNRVGFIKDIFSHLDKDTIKGTDNNRTNSAGQQMNVSSIFNINESNPEKELKKDIIIHEQEKDEKQNCRSTKIFVSPTLNHSPEEFQPSAEESNDADPDVIALCSCLDMSSFCLTLATFTVMTMYALLMFHFQDKPTML